MVSFMSTLHALSATGFNQYSLTDPAFYEAQAIVLSNMGEDRQALMIYVFKIQDYHKAEEYVEPFSHLFSFACLTLAI